MARRVIVLLLAVHTGLLAYSAYVHSPTLNEPGHLVAGLSHWKFGRFELYRVNPPLIRMIAALPVMAAGYEEDWSGFYDGPGARPVFSMGDDFVEANRERSFFLFVVARWACIPFSWIGGIVCYLWGRDLYSRPAGIVACTLWCFSPNILAHASLITADTGGSALAIAACYSFWRWLKTPTWSQSVLTAILLGLAELAKTTLLLFYPLWPLLWIGYRCYDRHQIYLRDWTREASLLLLQLSVGLYVLNFGYGFEGSFKTLNEFHFVSNLFTGNALAQDPTASLNRQTDIKNPKSTNRFACTWVGSIPVPIPRNYLIGIDIQQRDFEDYRRPSYLRGNWRDHGWRYYYLYAASIKIPLGIWLLGIVKLTQLLRPEVSAGFRDTLVLLVPPLLVFCVVSAKTGFSEHFRYVLPCFPSVFIWISRGTAPRDSHDWRKNLVDKRRPKRQNATSYAGRRRRVGFMTLAFPILLLWSIGSSLWVYPHSLSYFNELVGGPRNGSNHLLGSNVDWGQDLRYLKWWQQSTRYADHGAKKCFYLFRDSYHARFLNPMDLGAAQPLTWPESTTSLTEKLRRMNCRIQSIGITFPIAISVNILRSELKSFDGLPRQLGEVLKCINSRSRREISAVFTSQRIGYSLHIYDFPTGSGIFLPSR